MEEILSVKSPTSCERTEQRAVIKFCVTAGMTPTDTWKFMNPNGSAQKVSRTVVFDWHRRFKDGRGAISDDPRSGRPKDTGGAKKVESLVLSDRRKSVDELADTAGLGHATVHKILKEDMKMTKVCTRWVPRLLTQENMRDRVEASEMFLRRWRKDGDRFLNRIITTDETWVNFYDPETKRESMMWKHTSSPPPKKARTMKSAKKIMFIFFCDNQGMLLQHAVPSHQTVNKEYYQKVRSYN